MKKYLILLLALMLAVSCYADAKRTVSGGSRRSSSSGSNWSTRRSSSNTHTQSHNYVTSRPASSQNRQSNHDNTKLTYSNTNSQPSGHSGQQQPIGWNVPNKAQGPPPAYSANNPTGGAKTNFNEKPPAYNAPPAYPGNSNIQPRTNTGNVYGAGTGAAAGSSYPRNNANSNYPASGGTHNSMNSQVSRTQTARPLQSGSYPKQQLPAGSYPHGQPTYYKPGQLPAGATLYRPPVNSAPPSSYYHPQQGYQAPGGHYYPPPPPQAPPVYAGSGVQPGYYPAGSFPKQNSGPGFGTGLLAGAVGGAVLGHVLTPSHREVVHTGGVSQGVAPAADNDRIIIINNGPPGSVTASDGVTVINGNNGQPMPAGAAAPAGMASPADPSVPLAPFNPGSTHEVAAVPGSSSNPPPLIHTPTNSNPSSDPAYPDGAIPLAPFAPGTINENTSNPSSSSPAPASGGVMCYPILVNVTSETDPTNITQVEQIACYEVPADYDPNAPKQPEAVSETAAASQQKPDLMHMPGEGVTQKTSTASIAESAQIKQNSANGVSPFTTISGTIFAVILAYCLQ